MIALWLGFPVLALAEHDASTPATPKTTERPAAPAESDKLPADEYSFVSATPAPEPAPESKPKTEDKPADSPKVADQTPVEKELKALGDEIPKFTLTEKQQKRFIDGDTSAKEIQKRDQTLSKELEKIDELQQRMDALRGLVGKGSPEAVESYKKLATQLADAQKAYGDVAAKHGAQLAGSKDALKAITQEQSRELDRIALLPKEQQRDAYAKMSSQFMQRQMNLRLLADIDAGKYPNAKVTDAERAALAVPGGSQQAAYDVWKRTQGAAQPKYDGPSIGAMPNRTKWEQQQAAEAVATEQLVAQIMKANRGMPESMARSQAKDSMATYRQRLHELATEDTLYKDLEWRRIMEDIARTSGRLGTPSGQRPRR